MQSIARPSVRPPLNTSETQDQRRQAGMPMFAFEDARLRVGIDEAEQAAGEYGQTRLEDDRIGNAGEDQWRDPRFARHPRRGGATDDMKRSHGRPIFSQTQNRPAPTSASPSATSAHVRIRSASPKPERSQQVPAPPKMKFSAPRMSQCLQRGGTRSTKRTAIRSSLASIPDVEDGRIGSQFLVHAGMFRLCKAAAKYGLAESFTSPKCIARKCRN